jgi:coenzyme F420-0:L-glutamate ligase/coenzyme F420-1:gamma-L-glutamate ligase
MNDPAETFYALARDRHSIRRFRDTPVARNLLERVLGAALQAPSAHNRQPWRFLVLTGRADRELLAAVMGECLRRDRAKDGDGSEVIEQDIARSWMRITGAPAVVVICLTMEEMDHYPDARRNDAEYQMAIQSTAMAGENILLAAHAEGLGACWLCAPLFAGRDVQQAFDLPQSWLPQGLILLGYPQEESRKQGRKPLDEVSRWR